MISRKVLRLVRKTFRFEDVEASLKAIESAGSGWASVKDVAALPAHFSELLNEVDKIFAEYDDKLRQAMRNMQISSDELHQKNFTIEKLNIAMGTVLQSLGQGLLFFDLTGVCSTVFSQACLTLLERDPSNTHICEVLELTKDETSSFQSLIDLMFNPDAGALSFEDLIGLAPQEYRHKAGLLISLKYRPMRNVMGALTGVLVIATDITQEAMAKEALRQKEVQTVRTLRIARNRDNYVRYLQNFQTAISTLSQERPLEDIQRDLHTLKGMAKVFSLDAMAQSLHSLEDKIRDISAVKGEFRTYLRVLTQDYQELLEDSLEEARSHGREIWGDEFDKQEDHISVEARHLLSFARVLRTTTPEELSSGAVLSSYFDMVASVPFTELLGMFDAQATYFGEMADRPVEVKYVNKDNVKVFPDFYKDMMDTFVHIARNLVDHAAAPAEERMRQGKKPELHVTITLRYTREDHSEFMIEIVDDGRGIDANRIAHKLRNVLPEEVLKKMTPADLLQRIFDSGVTTRDTVTMSAGRGVGMNAVKDEVEKLGGSVWVESTVGEGTVIRITVPVIWQQAQVPPAASLHIVNK